MRGRKYLGVALAVAMPLAAAGYLVWVYLSTTADLARQGLSGTTSDPAERWFESDPVDPADLHGTWASRAEAGGGTNRRESVLNFRPDGVLVWTTRVTVGDAPAVEVAERHDYRFERGRFLRTVLAERSFDGQAAVLRDADRLPKFWKLDWKADDKSTFQLRTDPGDLGRPHLLFRRSPPQDKQKG